MRTHLLAVGTIALATLMAACGGGDDGESAPAQGADAGVDVRSDGAAGDASDASPAEGASDATAGDVASESAEAAADATEEPVDPTVLIDAIEAIAAKSDCSKYQWKDRGQAPKGYVEGVALIFGRAVCNPTRSDVVVVSQAATSDDQHDALAWYASIFSGLGMDNSVAGVDTLRHAYTLLLGLGMRESSGEHCCGRDMSASNTTASTAEAGAWQTSYDSHVFSPELDKLFAHYRADDTGCLLGVFSANVTCSAADWECYGSGDGYDFQKLEKECPAFAGEYAAVMLRVSGGSAGHYGPLRTRAAEVRPECDAMFHDVQTLVEQNKDACGGI